MSADTRGLTLALDASTYVGTVAVFDGARLVAEGDAAMRGRDEERLMPAVEAVLAAAGAPPSTLARVVCGAGPGSFTSLRIAGAIAKGIAVAAGLPLHAVPTAALMADPERLAPGRYLALLDAMRGDVYATAVDLLPGRAPVIGETLVVARASALDRAAGEGRRTLGADADVVVAPHARAVCALLAADALGAPVALDAWEPAYGRLAEAQVKWEAEHGRPLAPR